MLNYFSVGETQIVENSDDMLVYFLHHILEHTFI